MNKPNMLKVEMRACDECFNEIDELDLRDVCIGCLKGLKEAKE